MAAATAAMIEQAETEYVEVGERGGWLRAWPSGHVHFAPDWVTPVEDRMDTLCGRNVVYWPEIHWPKAKVCPTCIERFEPPQ
jgi:hypothetical protein